VGIPRHGPAWRVVRFDLSRATHAEARIGAGSRCRQAPALSRTAARRGSCGRAHRQLAWRGWRGGGRLTGCVTLTYGKRNVCDVRGASGEAARGAVLLEQMSAEGEPDPVACPGNQEGDAGGRAAARGCAGHGHLVEDQAVAREVRVVPFSPRRRWCCFPETAQLPLRCSVTKQKRNEHTLSEGTLSPLEMKEFRRSSPN
jgi:hypothetical protein